MADSTAPNEEPGTTSTSGGGTERGAGQAPRKRRATRSSGAKAGSAADRTDASEKKPARKTTRRGTRKSGATTAPVNTGGTGNAEGPEAAAEAPETGADQPRKRRATRTSGTRKSGGRSGKIQTADPVVEGPDASDPVEQAVQATAAAASAETHPPATEGPADADVKMAPAGAAPRKRAKRAVKRTSGDAPVAPPESSTPATPAQANPAADFDRSQLGDKTRVHALAKALGMVSRDLIVVLDDLGMVKVAQSSLRRDEAERLLDALAGTGAQEAAAPTAHESADPEEPGDAETPESDEAAAEGEPVEKIRTRVRKNVANEIHQIEEKVEADLAAVVEEHRDSGLLEDVTPAITPKPESSEEFEVAKLAPLFRAPQQGGSRTGAPAGPAGPDGAQDTEDTDDSGDGGDGGAGESEDREETGSRRRRRGRRGAGRGRGGEDVNDSTHTAAVPETAADADNSDDVDGEPEEELPEEPVALKGSTRLEAQRRRRTEMREEGRKKRHIVTQAEFLARRESVERTMVVRERQRHDHAGLVTQVGVLEDDLLVEHFVTSEAQSSMIGNIYLGRVQNVLPSMEAAFIDIGKGRNGVLYAGEVDWKSAGLGGRGRRIEQALKSGDQVLVQVTKDPVGHKGARLTTQISLAGRYLVYVPGGRSAGISRKLPGPERKRLKEILNKVVPGQGGAIIRTAAEGVSEEAIATDVNRLHRLWEDIQSATQKEKESKGAKPVTMYEEPDMLVKVVRDLFNEDFTALVVDGDRAWKTVHAYVKSVAPDLLDRVEKYDRKAHEDRDAFAYYRVDEQLQKALAKKVWLPSGGTLIIEPTEAMTVIDVNTGKFTGSGGNLEETVTRNNLEAAEEIVRQMRLRDIGGMIVVDFIDMVLPENQDLVLRRLTEALGRDRTRHQVSEVTSLGLVQMTRKRLGTGLLETFSTECEHCGGRGLILHDDPVEERPEDIEQFDRGQRRGRRRGRGTQDPEGHPAATAMKRKETEPRPPKVSSDSDIEELAASVIVTEEDGDRRGEGGKGGDAGADHTDREGRDGQPRARRRGRRDRGRDRERSHDEGVSDIEEIVSAALERADEDDPDEPSGADLQPEVDDALPDPLDDEPDIKLSPTGEKSFQQAVAEWERSPRRRRRTRGNSRSDHRPRPEDFGRAPSDTVTDWESVPGKGTDAQDGGGAGHPEDSGREQGSSDGGAQGSRRRGRRRSTRGGSRPGESRTGQDQKPRESQEPQGSRGETTEGTKDTAGTETAEAAPDRQSRPGRRGRRRAVRRTATGADVEQRRPEPRSAEQRKPEPAPEESGPEGGRRRSGRGRRRAVRRTSSS